MERHAKERPILILGGSGLLGRALVAETEDRRLPCVYPDRAELDLLDLEPLSGRLASFDASAVINTAAFTDVTGAEAPQRREEVWGLNRDLPWRLAEACAELGLRLAHISTDYVFDGRKRLPYVEDDVVAPLQVYGRSKLEGEQRAREALQTVLIVRTSTLFGPRQPGTKLHFVDAILERGRERGVLELVAHPISSPTYAPDLARAVLDLLDAGAEGTVHAANDGSCTRVELATEALVLAGLADRVRIIERPEEESRPPRPGYSVLDTTRLARLIGERPRAWGEALADYLRKESAS